jgi:uncharacterized protein with von Willebrand factor type A (vWA) domain
MALRYRYSEWDDTQEISGLNADEILDGLSDDLMNFGDLQHALRNMMQRGMQTPQEGQTQGLRDLLQQLRQQRRERLDRFDMGGVMEGLRRQLDEILEMERDMLTDRLGESDQTQGAQDGALSTEQGEAPESEQSGQSGGGQLGGTGEELSEEGQFQRMLELIAQRKQDFLDQLPPDPAGQMKELQDYEFLNPDAQHKFQELMEQLRQAMTESLFNDVSKMVEEVSDGDMQRMKDMTRDLNDMLAQRMRGEEPEFDSFMENYGDMFGENPPQSLDELIEQMQAQMQAMQSLMESMPSDQRQQLQSMLIDKLGDAELESELSELAQNLDFLNPSPDQANAYPFRGDEELDLQAAMELMSEMQNIDGLESALERAQYTGELENVDLDQLRELLGDEAVETFEELKKLLEVLEKSGYIRKDGDEWELTPRGTRMIGQNALAEIFRSLKNQGVGNHPVPQSGRHGERLDESKPYEFGDPFHLDMRKTIMNALEREGAHTPINLSPDDFEVYRSELVTQTATVLMVDLSWSMALRGSFQSAKKVALALQNLIKAQYPRDSLYIIGFSALARELKPQELPYVRWDDSVLGTNMHHALMIAEKLLAKHRGGTRQILMISDGEPTAHLERGRSVFAYPPSPVTIRETLKAVKRLSQQDITINTFMLDRNYYLKEFVNQLAKINGGRVFYTTPDKLGEYILVDYVQHKRKKITGR